MAKCSYAFQKCIRGARIKGKGEAPPQETGKSGVEKWCYFRELYKMPEIQEDWIWVKSQFSFEILECKFNNFLKNFNLHLFLAKTRKDMPLGFLISF